ncbi:MAG: hypothetical protein J1F16_09400 [Muribaculaceae bacterium]|nr:hypothetical protein [Muribaculaceae bacterium]
MATLHFFNPEHDLALAVGAGPYTPPGEVVKLRKEFSLLPATYAASSDFIMLPPEVKENEIDSLRWYDKVQEKSIRLITYQESGNQLPEITHVRPWGWDHAVRQQFLNLGIPQSLMPDTKEIESIRRLSHRRMAISFRKEMENITGKPTAYSDRELFSISEVEEFLKSYPISYFKAPWSSSGRGIVVSDHISHKGLLEWAHGVIKKQGSVIAEEAWPRVFDFATEWWIENRKAEFIGYSVFQTSSRGKYHGNIEDSQPALIDIIRRNVSYWHPDILQAQRETLDKLISAEYSGPLGIDMFVDTMGNINTCVEINLRLTMGFIAIEKGRERLQTKPVSKRSL